MVHHKTRIILQKLVEKEHFLEAVLDYQKRERRFGKTSDQIEPVQKGANTA